MGGMASARTRLLSCVHSGQKPDLPRLLLSHQSNHLGGPVSSIKAAHLWACLAEHCIVCCYLHAHAQSNAKLVPVYVRRYSAQTTARASCQPLCSILQMHLEAVVSTTGKKWLQDQLLQTERSRRIAVRGWAYCLGMHGRAWQSIAEHGRTAISETYCDVTHHLQDVASAHCIACYHGYDWLGHPPYLHLNANSDTSASLQPCFLQSRRLLLSCHCALM